MFTMIMQTLAAGIGTMAFCVLFSVPQKYFLDCGFVGVVEWIVYLIVKELCGYSIGIFAAALTITVLSRYFAVKRRCPMTIFLVTGIFPLVPGAGIYHMAYFASLSSYNRAIYYFMEALKAAFAIAVAIAVGSAIPAKYFQIAQKEKKMKKK